MMKQIRIVGVCLLVLWLCAVCVYPISAASPMDAARTFVWDGNRLDSTDTTAAFWEYPQLTAGQTRRGGSLTIINQGVGSVTARLTDVQLPYDNDDAIDYLNALHLTIRDGDQVLYDGMFARINDEGLAQPITLKWGETRTLSIDLSCDFDYEGITTCGQVLYWDWQMTGSWLGVIRPVLDTWMFWAPALLLIIALLVWRRMRRARKPEPVKQPTEVPDLKKKADGVAVAAAAPELPPDLPPPAPRKPVTIQIDGSAPPAERKPKPAKPTQSVEPTKPTKPATATSAKPVEPTKPTEPAKSAKPETTRSAKPAAALIPAAHAAPRHAKPAASANSRRRKAAHAAPRHAKKK